MPPSSDLRSLLESGVALHKAGDLDGAGAIYRQVLARAPQDADALHLSGLIAFQRDDHVTAWDLVQKARAQRPRSADIVYNLGRIAMALQDWPAAVEATRAALTLSPRMSAAMANLGIALVHCDQAAEGEASIRAALAAEPRVATHWSALGLALHAQAKDADARAAWQTARALDPTLAEATFNLATSCLRDGDFATGWPLFTARASADAASFTHGGAMPATIPRWAGEPLAGKTVLIWGEQGLGDQILFAGFVPMLSARHIVLACAPRLVSLFARAFPAATVLAQNDDLAARLDRISIDVQIPIGDLGRVAWPTKPAPEPRPAFLVPDAARVAALRQRYRTWSSGGPLVGLSWHSHRATAGQRKSLPLAEWGPVLAQPGVTFVSLQYGDTEADLAAAGRAGHAVHADPEIDATHDLDALAAQIAALDLVISVSNTTVHIAGALGVPVWTLAALGSGSLWYWFAARDPWQASPWYPRSRIYHQNRPGEWPPMLQRIKTDLAEIAVGQPSLT